MKALLQSGHKSTKGAALVIILAFVVLLTGLALAYFSRTSTDRQLAQSSYNDTSADLLARSALDIVVSDLKREIINNSTVTTANIQPTRYPAIPTDIPNLIRYSSQNAPASQASTISSTSTSANGRSISTARWNRHYLVPRGNTGAAVDSSPVPSFTAPDWVLVTAQGPASTPAPSAVTGRYAFAVYDEGGLLDMGLAGAPTWTQSGGGGPTNPSPTPWATNVGRKGTIAFADLTALPAALSTTLPQTQINNIVGWRNFGTTGQSDGSFASPTFRVNDRTNQDTYGSYLLDFGDPPYPSPCPIYPFTSVATDTSNSRTDQAIMTRQELLQLRSSLGFSQNVLQYMGTFSRERNQPARDWYHLTGKLADRFDIGMLSLVKPNPPGTPPSRGKGKGKRRGQYKGDAATILNLFGLQWVAPNLAVPDPHQLAYWGHWRYVGTPGVPPNSNPHVPKLRGGRNDFFQILDYAITQANVDNEDIVNAADILSLGASLIDQNDFPGSSGTDDSEPRTGTHITIIETVNDGSGKFVLGWENGEAAAASDTNPSSPKNPYNWIIDPTTSTTKPRPSFTPIVLNHAFSTTGDLGYGLRPEYLPNRFQRLDFHTANPNASVFDFFSYSPIDHNYPRAGIVNLNTRNVPVIAAILQSALKKDIDVVSPPTFPTISSTEATSAAQLIVNATTAQAALNRADIGRLTFAGTSAILTTGLTAGEETEKGPEAIARALCEVTQARTWNLFIDVVAQTGRYAPGTGSVTEANKFTVEGEKRYWLHIALGRDLVNGSVDVLGMQIEEVVE
jgi:Tfp pilus assembly protein PilX